ncbi:hypothetical protein QU38_00985, partial [Staphylococcus aureus]
VEGAGDRLPVAFGEDQQHLVRHLAAEQREEVAGEIGAAPFAAAGVLVEGPEGVPMRLGDLGAGQVPDGQARHCRRALLADRLALAAGKSAQELVEAPIAFIGPMELGAGANRPAGRLEQGHLGVVEEGDVRRGKPVLV